MDFGYFLVVLFGECNLIESHQWTRVHSFARGFKRYVVFIYALFWIGFQRVNLNFSLARLKKLMVVV